MYAGNGLLHYFRGWKTFFPLQVLNRKTLDAFHFYGNYTRCAQVLGKNVGSAVVWAFLRGKTVQKTDLWGSYLSSNFVFGEYVLALQGLGRYGKLQKVFDLKEFNYYLLVKLLFNGR